MGQQRHVRGDGGAAFRRGCDRAEATRYPLKLGTGRMPDELYSSENKYRIACADLREENRRIARHIVNNGILHAHEPEFEPAPGATDLYDQHRCGGCADCAGIWPGGRVGKAWRG